MIVDIAKLKRLWVYLRPYWVLELLTLLVMLALASLTIALPIAVKYLIDGLIPKLAATAGKGVDVQPIAEFAAILVGIYVAQIAFSWVRDYLAGYIGAHFIADLRSALFGHLEDLSLKFHQQHKVGEIMSRLLNDVFRIQDLMIATLLVMLTNVLTLIAILAYLLNVEWQLTLIALVPVPLTVLFTGRFGKRLHITSRHIQETTADLSARVQESLVAIKVVKAFGQEQKEQSKVSLVLDRLSKWLINYSVIRSLSMNVVTFINMVGPIVVLSAGAYMVAAGTMKLGALISFYMLISYVYSPIQSLAGTHIEVQAAMASVDRIIEYLDLPPAVREDPSPEAVPRARGEIEMRNISFAYGESGFKLNDLNLQIRAGETVAIVGPSGSGKTTIINLIMRFYDPDSGSVSLDGTDLRHLAFKSLRDNIALVDQDPLLFNSTIAENIAYSNPEVPLDEIKRVATIANIHDFIEALPDKYNTIVGERGVTLSGGERQRICLARAILKDPPILILDEATSSLDSISEQLIQDALDKIIAEKTAIVIAHRLSTVQRADRIIVLRDGTISDQGTHQQLLEKSALYRDLAQKQLKL